MTQYSIGDCVLERSDPLFEEALANAYRSRERPLCLCSTPGVPMYIAELGFVFAAADVGSAALILYGAYLLYNKKKQGAQIAIATAVVVVAVWITMAPEVVPLADGLSYLGLFIVMVAGPVLLFPEEYS